MLPVGSLSVYRYQSNYLQSLHISMSNYSMQLFQTVNNGMNDMVTEVDISPLWNENMHKSYPPRWQSSWGQHGAHLGPVGPRWAPCWPHEPCYQAIICSTTTQLSWFVGSRFGSNYQMILPCTPGLFHKHWAGHAIAQSLVKQPWRILVNTT